MSASWVESEARRICGFVCDGVGECSNARAIARGMRAALAKAAEVAHEHYVEACNADPRAPEGSERNARWAGAEMAAAKIEDRIRALASPGTGDGGR